MRQCPMLVMAALSVWWTSVVFAQTAPAPVIDVQSNFPSLNERLKRLERRLDALPEVMLRIDRLQQEIRALRGSVEVQDNALESIKKRQRDLYLDVDQRLSRLQAERVGADIGGSGIERPAVASETTKAGPIGITAGTSKTLTKPTLSATPGAAPDYAGEEQAYQKAFDLLKQGRYQESNTAFHAFLDKYPAGNYADNAQYWLGESGYVTRDFETALKEFEKVVNRHPYSDKVPGAMLKSAYILGEMEKWSEARNALTKIIKDYPGTTESRLATKRLERMRAEGH